MYSKVIQLYIIYIRICTHTHTHIYIFLFRFFSVIGYYKVLNSSLDYKVGPYCFSTLHIEG